MTILAAEPYKNIVDAKIPIGHSLDLAPDRKLVEVEEVAIWKTNIGHKIAVHPGTTLL